MFSSGVLQECRGWYLGVFEGVSFGVVWSWDGGISVHLRNAPFSYRRGVGEDREPRGSLGVLMAGIFTSIEAGEGISFAGCEGNGTLFRGIGT